jgi:hypothetical protein
VTALEQMKSMLDEDTPDGLLYLMEHRDDLNPYTPLPKCRTRVMSGNRMTECDRARGHVGPHCASNDPYFSVGVHSLGAWVPPTRETGWVVRR